MATADKTIEIRDVGPVHQLTIPIPAGGGLVICRGLNGVGKSKVLEAVSALVGSGDVRPVSRDGSLGAYVEGLGARLTVGRRTAVSGEIEVAHLEGEDPSLLVDPGLKDQDAADAARIRALLRLARAKVDVGAFAALVGGPERLVEICRPASLESRSDVPAMASSIKRDFEAAARKAEQTSENVLAKARGIRATLEAIDPNHGSLMIHQNAQAARAAHTEAVRMHATAKTTNESAAQLRDAANEAAEALKALDESGTQESVSAAALEVGALNGRLQDNAAAVRQLEQEAERLHAQRVAADLESKKQERDAKQRQALQRAIAAAVPVAGPDQPLEPLEAAIESAQAEAEAWGVHERTERVRAEISELEQQGATAAIAAHQLRDAARGTERIVLDAVRAVSGDDVELHDGRLYVNTDRGRELFSDLSQGERWRKALDIAVKAVGASGLLVIRQEAYESMDPVNRREVADYARKLGVVILTAECSVGGIRAEVFDGAAE
jgi:hypothetical protein